ncbi:MAG: HAD-IB family phosphatase [Gammaproteobacteria bacterium]|jgi:phosphoserine phosphatase
MSSIFESSPAAAGWPFYQHIIFDCDSTLSAIEGIDHLAAHPDTKQRIVALTNAAMDGEIPLDAIYGKRLELISPSRQAVQQLAQHYQTHIVPGAREVVSGLINLGCDVYIVSGGLIEPVKEFGISLGVSAANIRAVEIQYDQLSGNWWQNEPVSPEQLKNQRYLTYRQSDLAESDGKARIIDQLIRGKKGASLLIGDGISDLMARNAVDLFVGFGGVVARQKVLHCAPVFIQSKSLVQLLAIALGDRTFFKLNKNLRDAVSADLEKRPPVFNRQTLRQHFESCFASPSGSNQPT